MGELLCVKLTETKINTGLMADCRQLGAAYSKYSYAFLY